MSELPELFNALPSVYAVHDKYIIAVPVTEPSLMWVNIGGEDYYDEANGVMRSASLIHMMTVPQDVLERTCEYTVFYRRVLDRKPYYPVLGDIKSYTSVFRPVKNDGAINIYHIADAHNHIAEPIAAGSYFKCALDLLILNGDIPNHSGDTAYFTAIHKIASEITHGEIPVIFSRGNHDMRGTFAEVFHNYTPTDDGKTYFTFRLGSLWGIVLDCAEDKADDSEEYGGTICCHQYRVKQTRFLENTVKNAEYEYNADGVLHRIVISHNPFSETHNPPFDIEQELYSDWCRILRDNVKPDLMICGHMHRCYVTMPGDKRDNKGQPCPVVVGSEIGVSDPNHFAGAAITLKDDVTEVKFTDNKHDVFGETIIERK